MRDDGVNCNVLTFCRSVLNRKFSLNVQNPAAYFIFIFSVSHFVFGEL